MNTSQIQGISIDDFMFITIRKNMDILRDLLKILEQVCTTQSIQGDIRHASYLCDDQLSNPRLTPLAIDQAISDFADLLSRMRQFNTSQRLVVEQVIEDRIKRLIKDMDDELIEQLKNNKLDLMNRWEYIAKAECITNDVKVIIGKFVVWLGWSDSLLTPNQSWFVSAKSIDLLWLCKCNDSTDTPNGDQINKEVMITIRSLMPDTINSN